MKKIYQRTGLLLALFFIIAQTVLAAPPSPTALQKIRFSQTPEQVRIVFDLDQLPAYNVTLTENPASLVVDLANTVNKTGLPQIILNDPAVNSLTIADNGAGQLKATIDLNTAVMYKVFTLKTPNRLVIDIIKHYDQKIQQDAAPGVKFTTWLRSRQEGPIAACILDIDPKSGYAIKPVLSNDKVAGLETLQAMAERANAVAAINGSYFALNGDILGLTKLDGTVISTVGLARTAMGVLPDGKVMIDQADYDGSVELPNGSRVAIAGVNCERGPDSLVLYNHYYNQSTNTNEYGSEYVVTGNKITAINKNNTPLAPDSIVLSAHGTAAQALAGLKIGDTVKITQTLGPEWDQTIQALGAGPMLVKNNSVFLTTKVEEFGSDVAGGRAPRSALGITKDGHVLLVVVDGRQQQSIGFTLLELALFMQELGAVNAMNLDGGGSSEMVINGIVVNKPSDGHERRIGDALVVVPQPALKLAN